MFDYYTNVFQRGNQLFARGILNGKQVSKVIKYEPYLFTKTTEESKYKTIFNEPVKKKQFKDINDAKNFIEKYKDVSGLPIYGITKFEYLWIYDTFKSELRANVKDVSVVSLDIENSMKVKCDFATAVTTTPNPITAITLSRNGLKATIGLKGYKPKNKTVKYFECSSEEELLQRFIRIWTSDAFNPDIITGWNIDGYDIPYLVNRITKILGEQAVKRLSPWGIIRAYDIEIKGQICSSYEFKGITSLDYMHIYKKFQLTKRERYTLDHIAEVELGVKKVDYSEYKDLDELYEKDSDKYFDYNIRDVELIDQLEAQLKYIELVIEIAFMTKSNFGDAMSSVKKWDHLIHSYLMDRNTVVEPMNSHSFSSSLVGGYVKDPIVGMHDWCLYFDLTSLYPHLIMQYNISPDTFVQRRSEMPSIDEIVAGAHIPDTGNSVAANGCEYRKDIRGFLPAIMEELFNGRKADKKKMLSLRKENEEHKSKDTETLISIYDNKQGAKKVILNEGYGALANQYNRWFSFNAAESITMSGQLTVKWAERYINEYFNKLLKTEGHDYVFYIDTDSVLVRLDDLVKAVMPEEQDKHKIAAFIENITNQKINPYVESFYEDLKDHMHAYEQKMHLKMESISKLCIIAKKKYLMNVYNQEGVSYSTPKLKMTGIQAIQTSTPQICKDKFKECFNIIMNEDEPTLQKAVSSFEKEFRSRKFEDIAQPKGINGVSKYSRKGTDFARGTPYHVKGAIIHNECIDNLKLSNKYEKITDGDKIKIAYMKQPNPFRSNIIAASNILPPEFKADEYIDYDEQFFKTFVKPLDSILKTIGWSHKRRNTLF